MTRAQIRTRLQIYLRDTSEIAWSDAELNDLINDAYALVQKEIVKVNANWHIAFDYSPVTAGTSWYPMPPTFGLKRLGLKSSSADTSWTYLKKKNLEDIETLTAGGGNYYAREGTWVGIFPAPTTSVSDGIIWHHCPIYSLSDDDEVPRIKTPIHIAIVYQAKILALGESDESTAESRQRLNEILGDLQQWYDVTMDGPDRFKIEA